MIKPLYFATNYNGKLACQSFIHVDIAPRGSVPQTLLDQTVFEIITKDNSHPPVLVKLYDMARLPFNNLTNVLTWPSHGMTSHDFKKWFSRQAKETKADTGMAIYFYVRCE
jgi:hypothetical protein